MCQLLNRSIAGVPAERATATAAAASTMSATAVNASAAVHAPRAPVASTLRASAQRRRLRAALKTISATAAAAKTKSTYGGRTWNVATNTSAAAPIAASSSITDRSACAGSMRASPLIDDGLVDEGAHLRLIVDVASRHELRHVHADELLARIDPVRRVIRTAPAELADRARRAACADILHDVEAEAEPLAGVVGKVA